MSGHFSREMTYKDAMARVEAIAGSLKAARWMWMSL